MDNGRPGLGTHYLARVHYAAFEEVRKRGRGVRLIGVAATNLAEAPMADLFEAPERTKLRQLTSAVDQVRERFGFVRRLCRGQGHAER